MSSPEFVWVPVEIYYAALLYSAYILIVVYVHKKLRSRHPNWTGLAEFLAMLPGLLWIMVGAMLSALYL